VAPKKTARCIQNAYFRPLSLRQKSNVTFKNFATTVVRNAPKFSHQAIFLAPTVISKMVFKTVFPFLDQLSAEQDD
jgi:hypothetical protein